jgi:hypothetical protein
MSIGFTGTRHGMTEVQRGEVMFLTAMFAGIAKRFTRARHGMCIGADEEFHRIARSCGYAIDGHPCNISRLRADCHVDTLHPSKSPLVRNADIVDASTVMIAAPYEATEQQRGGTWTTIRMARKAGRPLAIVLPSGEVVKERWPRPEDSGGR